ncbi:MAG: DUF5119 domain-containing protein [Dysgonamonadaceae bacterium]|jgi:hypothetical protein|nr:DUF5119 domain-containing protein [Dysgonamonadaceae bacterium]
MTVKSCLLLTVCLGLWSCDDRRDLIDLGENWEKTLAVKVKIDWSKAGINPENASIWFFNASDGTPALGGQPELTNDMDLTVDLPIGQYSILVFNGTVNDQDNIRFRGTDRYQTFEAYAYSETPAGNAAARLRTDKDADLPFITPPNVLAVDRLELLEITGRMIDRKEETVITFTPRRLVAQMDITIHFRGLIYSAPGGHSGVVTGMANSVFLASGKTGNERASHAFSLNNRTFYPDNPTDGSMSRSFLCFGLPGMIYYPPQFGETNNRLLLDILLRNGEHAGYSFDVTGGIVCSGYNDAVTGLNLRITMGVGGFPLPLEMQDPVTLPEVPEVDFSGGGGFDPNVNNWGENTDVPIPVD